MCIIGLISIPTWPFTLLALLVSWLKGWQCQSSSTNNHLNLHQQNKVFICPVKYLNIYRMNWHQIVDVHVSKVAQSFRPTEAL